MKAMRWSLWSRKLQHVWIFLPIYGNRWMLTGWGYRLGARFPLYVAIGACAFLVDYGVFLIWFFGTNNPYVANFFGICAGVTASFSLNRKYNFCKTDILQERAAKFVVVALIGMVVSSGIIMILIDQDIDARVAKVVAMGAIFVAQFIANASWTFR